MALTAKTCLPCRGGIPPLSYAQAVPYLEEVPDWELTGTGDRIERRFKFADFATALDFVNRVGGLAERQRAAGTPRGLQRVPGAVVRLARSLSVIDERMRVGVRGTPQ